MSWHRNNIALWSNGFPLSIEFVNISAANLMPSCQIDPRGAGVRIKDCRWQVTVVPRWGLVVEEAGLPSGFSTVVCRGENVLAPVGSHKLVSAAVRCAWPSWRHSKVKRAMGRIFENGGVIVFHVNTLSLFFPVQWSNNVVSLLIEDTITLYSNGRGKCILITTWKFCKKGFWRV